MRNLNRAGSWTAISGAIVFIFVLFISAYWEAEIRWLHFLQSWMYLVSIGLIWKRNKWGYFVGVGAALFWDYVNLFVTTFLKNGLAQAQTLVRTGHLPRPDLFLAVPGWFGNFAVIVGCVVAYLSIPKKQWSDVLRLATATAGTTAFFAVSMALCQPCYLALFSGLLHPHLHI